MSKRIKITDKTKERIEVTDAPKRRVEPVTLATTLGAWIHCDDELPPEGEVVETKVDDASGCRNKQKLKRQGRMWFLPDGWMYVYYTPTHWRHS